MCSDKETSARYRGELCMVKIFRNDMVISWTKMVSDPVKETLALN